MGQVVEKLFELSGSNVQDQRKNLLVITPALVDITDTGTQRNKRVIHTPKRTCYGAGVEPVHSAAPPCTETPL
jgi:hypothetical protein